MKHGFTLIELLVVVLIIGILAAVALPQYQVAVKKARVLRALPLLRSIVEEKQRYYLENGSWTPDLDVLDISMSYTQKTETEGHNWSYRGIAMGGQLNVDNENDRVYWGEGDLTINWGVKSRECYGKNAIGDRICKSLGGEAIGHTDAVTGWPVYRINF